MEKLSWTPFLCCSIDRIELILLCAHFPKHLEKHQSSVLNSKSSSYQTENYSTGKYWANTASSVLILQTLYFKPLSLYNRDNKRNRKVINQDNLFNFLRKALVNEISLITRFLKYDCNCFLFSLEHCVINGCFSFYPLFSLLRPVLEWSL